MNLKSKAIRIFPVGAVVVALLCALFGCSERRSFEAVKEIDEPVYRRAKDLLGRGMENEALENFLNLIQKRNGNAPESHLDAGNVYLNHVRDPVSAIYHFKRYKSLVSRFPSASSRVKLELIDDLIKTGTKEFAASFDAKVYQTPLERLRLLDTIEQLRKENQLLKDQLASTRSRLNGIVVDAGLLHQATDAGSVGQKQTVVPRRPVQASSTAPRLRRYTIKSGDNLYKIARKVYGDSNRWREILKINRSVIPDTGNLKVGTVIDLPE